MELNDKGTSANGDGVAHQVQAGHSPNGTSGASAVDGHRPSAIVVAAPKPEAPEKRESGGIALTRIAIQRPLLMLALAGERTPEQLFRLADEKVRPRLEALSGVGQVTVSGGRQREIQVKVDPSRLLAYGLTLQQVTQALGSENLDLPGGQ